MQLYYFKLLLFSTFIDLNRIKYGYLPKILKADANKSNCVPFIFSGKGGDIIGETFQRP
jgi:hypothetical protein